MFFAGVTGFLVTNIGFAPGLVGTLLCSLMSRIRYYQKRYAKCVAWACWAGLAAVLMLTSLVSPRF
jgi:hypothetical protein